MRQITRVICCATAGLAVVACGMSGTSGTPGTSTASATPTDSRSPDRAAVFPVTMTRTGGIAGFQDVVVVTRDGQVSLTSRGQERRQCRLTPEAADRLRTAASQVPWARLTPSSGRPSFPDDMVVMVRSPAGGPVRLEDPKVGAAGRVFQELLNDVSAGPAASRMCKAA